VAALASALDAPVLADALSGLRRGGHGHDHVVSAGHALGGAGWLDRHPPEVILRLGAIPTSKPVFTWLDRTDRLQILVDAGAPRDAGTGPRLNVAADPATVIAGLAALAPPGSTGWTARWLEADRAATAAQRSAIAAESFPNEPGIVAALDEALPSGATLWTASSMPVRDVDAYLSAGPRPLRLLANRGANGIDGFTSAALGGALAGDEPTYALAGDLSIVHDLSGLAAAGRTGAPVTIVAADNDGGGIFHFLPQADAVAGFERLFATPHGLDLVAAAQGLGVPAQRVADRGVLESLVSVRPDGPRLVVVPTDRTTNVAVHRRIQTAVTAAVSELG
jgi:2-succinyl-5-enolpyruvyl-6-hydroxy-3-cyclohexene-1-carboxylate synthase